jgi:hypothetical protein
MHDPPTADEILSLVQKLAPEERLRLIRLLARSAGGDAAAYATLSPTDNEFSSDEEPLGWDADGWEDLR